MGTGEQRWARLGKNVLRVLGISLLFAVTMWLLAATVGGL